MSDNTAKDIIDEITEEARLLNVKEGKECKEELDDEINSEETKDEEPSLNDFIDEAELKKAQENLTEEEKDQQRSKSLELKNKGNDEYKCGQYLESLQTYTEALRICPVVYPNDRAVLYSNRAASKINIKRNQTAIDDCSSAIDLNPTFVRAYLRRAKLYEEVDKLEESLEDYKKILEIDPGINEARKATVRLPPLIQEKQEKLKTEMLGKLKDLGNMILKPFGLSTENFQLNQDPSTGGYSVNFQQNK